MTLTVELTLEQLAGAIRVLSPEERANLFRLISELAPKDKSVAENTVSQVAEQKSDYTIARSELDRELALAAEALLPDYANDKELTVFSVLDAEDFYAEK